MSRRDTWRQPRPQHEHDDPTVPIAHALLAPDECFNALCGYDEVHEHGDECTTDCLCGKGEVVL